MERNNFSNSLKDHNINGYRGHIKDCSDNPRVKDSWNYCNSGSSYGEDCPDGFSWPPRSYTCSFCKREFRSAQALGGHMNVHRRDRARLRQSPPPPRDGQYPILNLNLSPNPNPNPNFSKSPTPSSSPPSRLPPLTCTLTSFVSSPISSLSSPSASPTTTDQMMKKWGVDGSLLNPLTGRAIDLAKTKTTQSSFGVGDYRDFIQEDECSDIGLKKAEFVRLDLEIGLLSDLKEDLDLELRLGYS